MSILLALLVFSILILFHESGHFLAAKACRVTVIEFSLGMGPRLLSHVSKRSGTRYSLKLLPFGGSCQMKGEYGETEEAEDQASVGQTIGGGEKGQETRDGQKAWGLGDTASGRQEQAAGARAGSGQEPEGDSFEEKKVWQRMLIVAAGPLFNFLLALVFSLVLISQAGYDPPIVLEVTPNSPAEEAGIAAGDTLTKIGRTRISLQRDLSVYPLLHKEDLSSGRPLTVRWLHGGEKKSARILPQKGEDGVYRFGFSTSSMYRILGNLPTTVRYSFTETGYWIRTTFDSLRLLLTRQVSAQEVSGPVRIVKTISDTVEETKSDGAFYVWLNLLQLSILLSANLGVMNLLPFPALDGGRLVLLMIEAIFRRRLSRKVEEAINLAGFAALMGLAFLLLVHDVSTIIR